MDQTQKLGVDDREIHAITSLFWEEPVTILKTINTSHGEQDFREAVFVQTESGNPFVIKLADNDFTFADRIRMWQRCSADYRSIGYYAPAILSAKTGDFPTVRYKGHNCVAYAEEFGFTEANLSFVDNRLCLFLAVCVVVDAVGVVV